MALYLGYATSQPATRSARLSTPGVIHRGKYQRPDKTGLDELVAISDAPEFSPPTFTEWREEGHPHFLTAFFKGPGRRAATAYGMAGPALAETGILITATEPTFVGAACRLNHVCLDVADLEVATRFYVDALAGRLLREVADGTGRPFVRFLRLGGGVLELFERKTPTKARAGHLGVQVDDAAKTCAEIRAAGYPVDTPVLRPSGNLIAVLRDPDGNEIEIIQHAPSMDPLTWR